MPAPQPQDYLTLYTQYASELTMASPDYHLFVGLSSIGSVLNNKVFFPAGVSPICCNVWFILLGESRIDFKSTACKIAVDLLRTLGRQTKTRYIYPEEFSYEAMVKSLARDPAGTWFADEFNTFISNLNRKYNDGAKSLLSTLYQYRGEYERTLQKNIYKIMDPAPSIWCVTSYDWFINNLEKADISGGFIFRFLIIPSTRKGKVIPLQPAPDPIKRTALLNKLYEFSKIKGAGYMTPPAKQLHDDWFHKMLMKAGSGPFAPFAQSLQGYLIKFSMLLQVNEDMTVKIKPGAMRGAIGLINWLYAKMEAIQSEEIVFTPQEKDVLTVKKTIRKHSSQQPTRAELSRLTHLSKWHLDRAIETLIDRHQLQIVVLKQKGKRDITTYKLIGE